MSEETEQIILEKGIILGTTWPTMQKIIASGINTVGDLARQTPTTLSDQSGVGKDTCEKYIAIALGMVNEGYITGDQLWERMKTRRKLSTGSRAVNEILDGGIEEQTTTEVSGENGSGKTQLMHELAINAQLPHEQGGLGGNVVWIDTENTFRPDRIIQMCLDRDVDAMDILRGIFYEEVYHSEHQKSIIAKLPKLCQEHNIQLVIVDSMMAHLRSEYIGRGMLAPRQNMLGDMLQRLGKIAGNHKLTVVYTNQVMDRPVQYGNPQKAVGGHIMGHASTLRLNIKKGRSGSRIMQVKKSPFLPEYEALFLVTENGIEDHPDNIKVWAKEEQDDTT